MPIVSITRLRVRAWRYLPTFLVGAYRSTRQARRASGNLATAVLADRNFAFWTRTVWVDEAAVRAFMLSSPHRHVMPRLLDWCDEASLARWAQDTAEPPSWSEAHRRMLAEGRRSKVRHPSAAHQRFEFPAPRISE
jgi:heme-degrading monooxygenase HmoA